MLTTKPIAKAGGMDLSLRSTPGARVGGADRQVTYRQGCVMPPRRIKEPYRRKGVDADCYRPQ